MGFLEQGGERVHAEFNALERDFKPGITNRVDRLLNTVREHHLRISPHTLKEVQLPTRKKRKLEE